MRIRIPLGLSDFEGPRVLRARSSRPEALNGALNQRRIGGSLDLTSLRVHRNWRAYNKNESGLLVIAPKP